MPYETVARTEEILGIDVDELNLAGRRAQVSAKGAVVGRRGGQAREDFALETVPWDAGTAPAAALRPIEDIFPGIDWRDISPVCAQTRLTSVETVALAGDICQPDGGTWPTRAEFILVGRLAGGTMATPQEPQVQKEKKRKALDSDQSVVKPDKPAKRPKAAAPSGISLATARTLSLLPKALPRSVRGYVADQAEALWTLLESDDDRPELVARRTAYDLFPREVITLGNPRLRMTEPPTKLVKKETTKGLQEFRGEQNFILVPHAGAWHQTLISSGQALKVARRDLQLLNHISQSLLVYVAERKAPTHEIEAMAVNNRILVSANDLPAFEELCGIDDLAEVLTHIPAGGDAQIRGKARKLAELMEALATNVRPDGFDDARAARGVQRLVQLATDCLVVEEQRDPVRAILATLHRARTGDPAARKVIDVRNPSGAPAATGPTDKKAEEPTPDFARLLTSPEYEGRILAVPPIEGSHAEQNLVLALIMSGRKIQASVAGGKRPCTVCWLTLSLTRLHGFQLCFGNRPGGFWNTVTEKGLHQIAEQLGITDTETLQAKLTEIASGSLDVPKLRQYVTSLSAAVPGVVVDLDEEVDRHAIREPGFSTAQLTQSYGDEMNEDPSPPRLFPTDAEADTGTAVSLPSPDVLKSELVRLAGEVDEDDLEEDDLSDLSEEEKPRETASAPDDPGERLRIDGETSDDEGESMSEG
ncbi:hypothetical protein ACGF5O_08010 [Streptomyces sp. NPDC048291]|uniref:hypothetical protein n=1 Tax=Streptomyces sp. NPDC048291 TaxID=3365530 RepID=UPI0037127CB6